MLAIAVLLFCSFSYVQCFNETHYTAAVVDFAPGNLSANTESFIEFIRQAKEDHDADIIVFPENGWNGPGVCTDDMYTAVPHPRAEIAPCDGPPPGKFTLISKALQQMSCIARQYQIYVVLNVREVDLVSEYNTNVVLDRNGTVIARYRKYHLFAEPGTSIPPEPEISFFDTDFGVRFGTFVCFDLMFEKPALQLIKQLGITDIAFTTHWFAELPFLTSVQSQENWAYSQDVNFLGSGYVDIKTGSGGSGIYAGRQGALVYRVPAEDTSELLVADVPKKTLRSYQHVSTPVKPPVNKANEVMFLKQDNLTVYKSASLEDLKEKTELCYNDFCCNFVVNYNVPDKELSYQYKAVVFDGVRSYAGFATGGVQVCAIVVCADDDLGNCGVRTLSEHKFTTINITGTFPEKNSAQWPSTLRYDQSTLSTDEFDFESTCKDGLCTIKMSSVGDLEDIITYGIYGRNFVRDGEEPSKANNLFASIFLVICSYFMSAYFAKLN